MTTRNGIIEAIGKTPLIKLKRASEETGCTILGKAEFMNPGQSVKDRAALFIIRDALNSGKLQPGGTVVEGTAGNTGIGLALVGNALGLKTVIVIPETQSDEKKEMLRLTGAELIEVPAVPYKDPNNYVKYSGRLAEELNRSEPHGAVWANQFDNVANRQGHMETTAEEIWNDLDGKVDGFVCAVGTGGTLAGVSMGLKAHNPDVVIGLADPLGAALYNFYKHGELKAEGSSITEGIGQGRITKNLEGAKIDEAYQIPDAEALPDRFRPAQRRRPLSRRLERHQYCRRHSSRPRSRSGTYDCHGPGRLRYPLPKPVVQSQIPSREGIAGSTMARPKTGSGARRVRLDQTGDLDLLQTKTWLTETDELARELDAPDLVIIDASWNMPSEGKNAHDEYLAEHIPGALFFDIDEIADTKSKLPHMLPPPEKFSSRMRSMGIGDGSRIVVYDAQGLYSAARVWWTFRVMGVEDVSVLNGGLPKWKREGRPLESGEPRNRTTRHFTARRNADLVRDAADIKALLKDRSAEIVDARSAERFAGKAPEPRPGLRSGHIPGARNLPFAKLLNKDGTLKSPREIERLFQHAGVDLGKPVVASCGSGITAGVLALALAQIGHRKTSVYDGSWSEWGADKSLPIETG